MFNRINQLTRFFSQSFPFIIYPLLAILFVLISANSVIRNYEFSYDSINYLQVANNIANGKGITGTAIGFNQSLNLDSDPSIPSPYIAQPAVYPILLAAFIQMGISALNAARVVSLVSITAILAGLYGFYWLVGKRSVAWLPLLFLAWFAPFREVIGFAWTEPLALAFLIWSLLIYLVHDRYPHWWLFPLSGFLAGMAAGTRFVIALLFVVYLVDLFVQRHPIKEIIKRSTLLFTAGAVTIVPTIIYNFISSGRILPAQLPTEKTFWVNLTDVFTAIFSQVFYKFNLLLCIGLVFLLLVGWILIRRSGQVFGKIDPIKWHYLRLLIFWCTGYLVVLLIQRSITFFSPLNSRILIMITVWMLLGLCLWLVILYQKKQIWLNVFCLLLCLVAIASETYTLFTIPVMDPIVELASSPRIKWLKKHTSEQDLIIGDNSVDVALILGNPSISFSAEPYTYPLEYVPLVRYLDRHCGEYPQMYMAIQHLVHRGTEYDKKFGAFIADLAVGRNEGYPEFTRIKSPDDLVVYQVSCHNP